MRNLILEPLQFEFMRCALILGIVLGLLCAVVGSYLIVQQMGMMGGVISHAVVPGLSIAFFLEINLKIGAFVAGLASALFIALIQEKSSIKVDTAMALTLSSFLALGLILITTLETDRLDLNQVLFGDILAVTVEDVWQTTIITAVIVILVKLLYKELLFYTFDALGAQAAGLPTKVLYFGLICAITLTIVATMQTVGVLLVMSLLVGPAITAYLLVKELHEMMILGAVLGAIANIMGMYLSYYLDLPAGPTIVMVVFVLFLVAFAFSYFKRNLIRYKSLD